MSNQLENARPFRRLGRPLLVFAVLGSLCVLPVVGQQVDGALHDPGFAHNHVGKTFGDPNRASSLDHSTYCGRLGAEVCGGGAFSQLLYSGQDPFEPRGWTSHPGNESTRQAAEEKGLPLQTLVVRFSDGSPASEVPVRFYQAGYSKKGIVGTTDRNGTFVVSLKNPDRNHRFLVDAEGHRRARLDVLGRDLATASHYIMLEPVGRRSGSVWRATNSPHRIAILGDDSVPGPLARQYKRALKAMDRGDFDDAAIELKILVERWPVGSLDDGGGYEPRGLLIEALEKSGQASLAETLKGRPVVVTAEVLEVSG